MPTDCVNRHWGSDCEVYIAKVRSELNKRFPDLKFYFKPPDIVTQVLNFGLAAPIDVQIVGPRGNYEHSGIAVVRPGANGSPQTECTTARPCIRPGFQRRRHSGRCGRKDNRIELRPVEIARDFGSKIGVTIGLNPDDKVVINPGDRMSQDLQVEIDPESASKS